MQTVSLTVISVIYVSFLLFSSELQKKRPGVELYIFTFHYLHITELRIFLCLFYFYLHYLFSPFFLPLFSPTPLLVNSTFWAVFCLVDYIYQHYDCWYSCKSHCVKCMLTMELSWNSSCIQKHFFCQWAVKINLSLFSKV